MKNLTTTELSEKIYQTQYFIHQSIETPFGKRWITYADYTASGQQLAFIEDYLKQVVLPMYANTHTEASATGRQTGHFREEARQIIKDALNVGDEYALLFGGSGSTGAIDKLVRQFQGNGGAKPIVFLGPYEHHSNILPWREGNFEVVDIPLGDDGLMQLSVLEAHLKHFAPTKRPMIGSFSAASNVTGIIAPVDDITTLLHTYGAWSFWDYSADAAYIDINTAPGGLANKDAIFISTHKLMGGPNTPGILIAKKTLFDRTIPTSPSGGTVHFVTKTKQMYHEDIETREEGGTPDIIGAIRAGLAFKLKAIVGYDYIEAREHDYVHCAMAQLTSHPKVFILGNTEAKRVGIIAFHIRCAGRFLHHNFVIALLNDLFGIQARGGCSCAGPYGHDLMDLSETKSQHYIVELATGNVGIKPGWARLNFNFFIPEVEFQFIVDAMLWIADNGWKMLKQYTFNDKNALWLPNHFDAPLQSLDTFLAETPSSAPDGLSNRPADCRNYLYLADQFAAAALESWHDVPVQKYDYPQVENSLRWYALADDMQVKISSLAH